MNFEAYINGQFVDSKNKIKIISPLTLKVIGQVPALKSLDIDQAFNAAQKAFVSWKKVKTSDKIFYLQALGKKLLRNKEKLAQIVKMESGKSFDDAVSEITRSVDYIQKTIESWQEIKFHKLELQNKKSHQQRVPLGVVLAISPFNFPINLAITKIAPAILVGNTVVFKAATNGSLAGAFISKMIDEINLPVGVFNYVTGRGRIIGDMLVAHPLIKMISFTGSVKTGQRIHELSSAKNIVLELGGNDAAYVRHDANLEQSLKEIIAGAFNFGGQRCTAIKRLILHKKIASTFLAKAIPIIRSLQSYPLISIEAANKIQELYKDCLKQNDSVLIAPTIEKNWVSPGLIQTQTNSKIWLEETFGPVLPFVIVNNDQDAILTINKTEFGLQNSIFTTDVKWALNISSEIESGTVNINGKSSRSPDVFPFLGIKKSGQGTQGVSYALKSMTRILNIVENTFVS